MTNQFPFNTSVKNVVAPMSREEASRAAALELVGRIGENKAVNLGGFVVKGYCNFWWMSDKNSFSRGATTIVGSYLVYANGRGNTTRIVAYDPVYKRVLTKTGSVYRLGTPDPVFSADHRDLMVTLGWYKNGLSHEIAAHLSAEVTAAKAQEEAKEVKIYPVRGQTYTYEEIQKLYLRDSPNLNFDLNGRKQCLQDSMASPEEIIAKSPRIAGSKWAYVRETHEWIPVFKYVDERPITDIIDRHREHGEYVFIFAGFPR